MFRTYLTRLSHRLHNFPAILKYIRKIEPTEFSTSPIKYMENMQPLQPLDRFPWYVEYSDGAKLLSQTPLHHRTFLGWEGKIKKLGLSGIRGYRTQRIPRHRYIIKTLAEYGDITEILNSSPEHFNPWWVIPCSIDPQWSQNVGVMYVCICHLCFDCSAFC